MFKSEIKSNIIKYIAVIAVIVVSGFANVNNLYPFAYATYYAATFAGLNPIVLSVGLIAGVFLPTLKTASVICALVPAAITSAVCTLLNRNKKQPNLAVMALIIFVGQSAETVFGWLGGVKLIYLVINLCLCYIYAYVAFGAFKPVFRHGMKYSLLDTEIACMYLVAVVISMGLTAFDSRHKIALLTVAALAIPTASRLIGKGAGVMLALSMGLGSAFGTFNITDVALLGFVSLAACMFISAPKILAPLAQIFAVVVFELFFEVDYLSLGYHAAATLIGGLIYALIPVKLLNMISERFIKAHSSTAIRHVINRNRYELARGVETVGLIFDDMSAILGGMEKDCAFAADNISKDIVQAACKDCACFEECRALGLESALGDLAVKALQKGKTSISDIPPLMVDKCLYIGKIMSVSAQSAARQSELLGKTEEDNKVTRLLATQMNGVSRILRKMSALTSRPVSYDYDLEKKVIEELKYYNVICSEALLCLGDKPTATLIVRRDCAESEAALIASVVGKILRVGFSVKSVDDSLIAGWSVMELESELAFDVLFGVASKPLNKDATGDTHSFMKIGGNKFLMAVCDGMGAGKKAFELSNKAMTLVEGFYRAGFDHELTVESINRFLNIEDAEGFSALDIAVCDLSECRADLVKLAAPSSYVKKADSVVRVDSSSLPLGVVGEVSPAVSTFELEDGDVIVITSDGVSQRFEGDTLSAFINNSSGLNPQLLADQILAEAEKRSGIAPDDMTVAVCRVFRKVA